MSIGTYDKRATIQSRTGARDALGNVDPTWSDVARRWCSLVDQSGNELYRAQQVDPTVTAVVTLREQYPGLSPEHRLVIGSRTFGIVSVLGASDRTPRHGQMLACKEEV